MQSSNRSLNWNGVLKSDRPRLAENGRLKCAWQEIRGVEPVDAKQKNAADNCKGSAFGCAKRVVLCNCS